MIPSLILPTGNYQVVKDQVAAILATEGASQRSLAQAAGETDLSPWTFRVYQDRSDPWENFREGSDQSPVVNVWMETISPFGASGGVVGPSNNQVTLNIDCFAVASPEATVGGHLPGDLLAVKRVETCATLVRNILMASEYVVLGLMGVVGKRWIESITEFQPALGDRPVHNIIAARVRLDVQVVETAPDADASNTLEFISVDVQRTEDGQVIAEADYDLT